VTATSTFGCVNNDTVTINVYPAPVANFGYTVNGRTVTFYDSSANAVSWHWFFGDGNESSQQNPLYTYSYDSTFTVMLIVTNGVCPGGDTITIQIPIITSGIQEMSGNADFVFGPNPVNDQLTISNFQLISNIEIYNAVGEKLFFQQQTTNDKQQTVDVSQLPPGIYYVKVVDEKNNLMTRKIVKM
jgi:PKD repeat protein